MGRADWIKQFEVEFICGDIRNIEDLRSALKNINLVVHLAADTRVIDSIVDPTLNFETNVAGSFALLSTMREMGVQRLVNASTGGAILGEVPPPVSEEMVPNPVSPYGASKLAVEGYCSAFAGAYGMSAASLRFSNVYGVHSYHKGSVVAHFYKNILAGRPLTIYGDGSQTRDYVFSRDLAAGILSAMKSGKSGVYQLGTGRPTTINGLIEEIRKVVERNYTVDVKYENFRDGEIRHTYCAIDKAIRDLNYAPATDLREGLEVTWEWFKRNRKLFSQID